jgi:hypothetical protein
MVEISSWFQSWILYGNMSRSSQGFGSHMPRVKMGDHYFLRTNSHVANEKLNFSKGSKTMLQQITHGAIQVDKKKKIVQFALIFHLLIMVIP